MNLFNVILGQLSALGDDVNGNPIKLTEDQFADLIEAAEASNSHNEDTWRAFGLILRTRVADDNADEIEKLIRETRIKAMFGIVPSNATEIVSHFAKRRGYVVRLNGTITGAPRLLYPNGDERILTEHDLAADPGLKRSAMLQRRDTTIVSIKREIRLICNRVGIALRHVPITDAVDEWFERCVSHRIGELFTTIDGARELSAPEKSAIDAMLETWVKKTFSPDQSPGYVAAVLRKFMWQCKRKMVGLPVTNHLMPVLLGKQGVGKSTVIKSLCQPLDEAVRHLNFVQVADERVRLKMAESIIVFLDEMSGAKKADMDEVKRVVTADRADVRPLGTNDMINRENRATFIGASNDTMDQLIRDQSGNRRFVGLNVLDEPDWKASDDIDWNLVWVSVDEQGEDPTTAYVTELKSVQRNQRNIGNVERWLIDLDPDHGAFASLDTDRQGWVRSTTLHAHFKEYEREHCDRYSDTTLRKFGMEMTRLGKEMGDDFPFQVKVIENANRFKHKGLASASSPDLPKVIPLHPLP